MDNSDIYSEIKLKIDEVFNTCYYGKDDIDIINRFSGVVGAYRTGLEEAINISMNVINSIEQQGGNRIMDKLEQYAYLFSNFSIEYNPHVPILLSVEQYIEDHEDMDISNCFGTNEDFDIAIRDNELWKGTVYCEETNETEHFCASSLERLFELIDKIWEQDNAI